MLKQFLEAGKIVGTHGIKGMLRVQAWCDSADFLKQFKYVYTDKNGENRLEIKSVQPHGNIVLMQIKGVNSIDEAEALRNKVIYISRKDAKLPEGRYFIDDLIGCKVLDFESSNELGTLTEVSSTGANDVWHITNSKGEYLVPAIEEVIVSVDTLNSLITIKPLKGIFDDED
ncbi:MAG: 16S rRNA processing protein RimM [Ruminococcaceae bacterium]|nr:16S rRNA processing protein RimM [Oscillospiraceae bacterium]